MFVVVSILRMPRCGSISMFDAYAEKIQVFRQKKETSPKKSCHITCNVHNCLHVCKTLQEYSYTLAVLSGEKCSPKSCHLGWQDIIITTALKHLSLNSHRQNGWFHGRFTDDSHKMYIHHLPVKHDEISWSFQPPARGPAWKSAGSAERHQDTALFPQVPTAHVARCQGCCQGGHWGRPGAEIQIFKSTNWLVVWTPLKNMKVNWDDYSQYMEK